MSRLPGKIAILALLILPVIAAADPLTIDLTTPVAAAAPAPYGPGTSTSPDGHTITADSESFLLDGKPWVPISGEFHYSRYPRAEWRDELLKMKAGGITVVSTYVFWIHQEEEQGKFDWSGNKSLRDFLLLCKEVGLKAFVRMGPWCHGEVRNGGFPDWVQNSGAKPRSTDPAFLSLVEPLYQAEAAQMKGLLWKDGGPVIGVQMDNENGNRQYLWALKKMAQDAGVDVPYYAVTGWDIKPPNKEFLLMFGAYFDGFWGGTLEKYRKDFMFSDVRASSNLGAQMNDYNPGNSENISKFPYLCVEIGPGMMSSYAKRIKVDPDAVTAMALIKLGEGNNAPGYYMYHGGMNPDGKLSTLEETHPNFMPLKDYDFQTAIGACGEVRPQFHMLLDQHLFLQDFGAKLARMPAFFPDKKPSGVEDFDTLRWSVRSDGTSAFLFFSNEQPYVPLPEHGDVQFALKTGTGTMLVPREPITIPSGSYGIWPVNMDCDGVTLAYATAQPLCRIDGGDGNVVYFFSALEGIKPQLAIRVNENPGPVTGGASLQHSSADSRVYSFKPDDQLRVGKKAGGSVTFCVLSAEESRSIWREKFLGRDRLILSNATVVADGTTLHLESENAADLTFSIFPGIPNRKAGSATSVPAKSGNSLFTKFPGPRVPEPEEPVIAVSQIQVAGTNIVPLSGTSEATWNDAAVYTFQNLPAATNWNGILKIHYIGDAARLYVGDKLFDDNYYNGDPFDIALWRIPPDQRDGIRLKVLPYSDALLSRLPTQAKIAIVSAKMASTQGFRVTDAWLRLSAQAKDAIASAKAASTLDKVTATAAYRLEIRIGQK